MFNFSFYAIFKYHIDHSSLIWSNTFKRNIKIISKLKNLVFALIFKEVNNYIIY